MSWNKLFIVFSLIGIITSSFAKEKLQISWADTPVNVDGTLDEWEGKFIIQKNTAIAVQNDASFLYIAFSTMDQKMIKSMMRFGFITWIDEGRKGKKIGLKFPLGRFTPGERMNPRQEFSKNPENATAFLNAQTEFEIIKDMEHILARLPRENNFEDIRLAVSNEKGKFNYEIAIPLDQTDDYNFSVDTKRFSKLKIGFEIPTPMMGGGQPGASKGMAGMDGSHPGGGGGRGSGGGGGRGGQSGMSSQRVSGISDYSVWYKTPLASSKVSK